MGFSKECTTRLLSSGTRLCTKRWAEPPAPVRAPPAFQVSTGETWRHSSGLACTEGLGWVTISSSQNQGTLLARPHVQGHTAASPTWRWSSSLWFRSGSQCRHELLPLCKRFALVQLHVCSAIAGSQAQSRPRCAQRHNFCCMSWEEYSPLVSQTGSKARHSKKILTALS